MRIEDLKPYLMQKAIKPLISLIAICILWGMLITLSNKTQQRLEEQQNASNAMQAQLQQLKAGIESSNTALNVWQEIKQQNFDLTGLKVQAAKKAIDDLKQSLMINNLEVNLLNPVIRKDEIKERVGLEYSDINITFSAYIDSDVFKFIDQLYTKTPGIFHFTNINIKTQEIVINDDVIAAIRAGQHKDLVQVKLSIVWQDFKNLKGIDVQAIK